MGSDKRLSSWQKSSRRSAPPPAPQRKPLLEVLIVPITLTAITAGLGFAATRINSSLQDAQNKRSFRAAQLAAVEKMVDATPGGNLSLIAPRLAAYEELAIPALFGALQQEKLATENRRVVETSLVQIGSVFGHVDEVGKAMRMILEDPWQLYGPQAHASALRVISSVCYPGGAEILRSYQPERVIQDGANFQANTSDWQVFQQIKDRARVRLESAVCLPESPEDAS